MTIQFTVFGAPRTKKNSQQIIQVPVKGTNRRRPIPIPSKDYRQYSRDFAKQIPPQARIKIAEPVNLQCVYFMPTLRRVDLVNLLEATCDILVDVGVLADDNSNIVCAHDGSRVMHDKTQPRVEITITPFADNKNF